MESVDPLKDALSGSNSNEADSGSKNCDSGPEKRNNKLSANAKTPLFGDAMRLPHRVNVIQSNPSPAFFLGLILVDNCEVVKRLFQDGLAPRSIHGHPSQH